MKRLIHLDNEPRSLASRRCKSVADPRVAWDRFDGKSDLHQVLLPTQHYLCSYCEVELSRDDHGLGYHIEHIVLKSVEPSLTFVFDNLMLSCFNSGHELVASVEDPLPVSCGHAQGKQQPYDTQLFIKPTEPDCEAYFYYQLDGRIVPHPSLKEQRAIDRVNYTINLLNLNCRRLRRLREDMIREGFQCLADMEYDLEACANFAELELAEVNKRYSSFITTRRQYFQDFINGPDETPTCGQ